jgi:hypothetical protein
MKFFLPADVKNLVSGLLRVLYNILLLEPGTSP